MNSVSKTLRVARSEPSSPLQLDTTQLNYFGQPLVPRLQRRLSATKKCQTCNKIVYFTGIRCKHCGFLAHEACADAKPHSCAAAFHLKRQQTAFSFTPEAISAATTINASVSAPVSPRSPKSPMSPTEFLRTAFSWIRPTRKQSKDSTTPVPSTKVISNEDRAATWSSPVTAIPEEDSNEDNNAVSEWCISSKDIKYERLVREGAESSIYEGRWHGPVSIYTFTRSQDLWTQVNRLMQIRHENCTLFMGACIERNNLAIVTSPCDGPQVADLKNLSLESKFSIARQVANGMGYLHARGIVHGKLNAQNVIMEKRRAKVCLLDRSFPAAGGSSDYIHLPKNPLASWAPELIQKTHVSASKISSRHPFTRASDVYAFGTFLYELFAEQSPFANLTAEEMLYKIGHGKTPNVSSMNFIPRPIRRLIADCWSSNPQARPTFKEIAAFLQDNALACTTSLNKRHSCSTPNRLDQLGLFPRILRAVNVH